MPPSWPLMDSPGLRGRSSSWTPAAAGFTASPCRSLKMITLCSSAPKGFSTGLILTQCPLCHRWISNSLRHWLLRACPSHPLSLFCVGFGFGLFSGFFSLLCFVCLFFLSGCLVYCHLVTWHSPVAVGKLLCWCWNKIGGDCFCQPANTAMVSLTAIFAFVGRCYHPCHGCLMHTGICLIVQR